MKANDEPKSTSQPRKKVINTAAEFTDEERAAIIRAAAEARKRSDKFTPANIRFYIRMMIADGTAGNIRRGIAYDHSTNPAAYTEVILLTGKYASYQGTGRGVTYCDPDYLEVRKKHNRKPEPEAHYSSPDTPRAPQHQPAKQDRETIAGLKRIAARRIEEKIQAGNRPQEFPQATPENIPPADGKNQPATAET